VKLHSVSAPLDSPSARSLTAERNRSGTGQFGNDVFCEGVLTLYEAEKREHTSVKLDVSGDSQLRIDRNVPILQRAS